MQAADILVKRKNKYLAMANDQKQLSNRELLDAAHWKRAIKFPEEIAILEDCDSLTLEVLKLKAYDVSKSAWFLQSAVAMCFSHVLF